MSQNNINNWENRLKRCSNCILPETTPNIIFDKNDVCNFCHSHKRVQYESESKLKELLYSYRNDGNKYDCVVGISGGRDSSYTLLKLVKDYNLKVLAVNYENPYTDPQAKINIDNAIEALNVDLVRFKLKGNIHTRTLKYNFSCWLHKPSPAAIPMICIACKNILPQIIKYAKKYDVKCIVTGGNPYEDTSFKKELLNVSADENHENTFYKEFAGSYERNIKKPFLLPSNVYSHNDKRISVWKSLWFWTQNIFTSY